MNQRELKILSEALEDYAVKYSKIKDENGFLSIRPEPEEALALFIKLQETLK